jgi:epoxyqueuosine reductase
MHQKSESSTSLEEKIKAEAIRLGFSLCGITTAQEPEHFTFFLHWIEAGHYAGMDYLATPNHIASRKTPSLLLPGVRSIISVGWSYPIRPPDYGKFSDVGWVAGYATGLDYHHLLIEKMELLSEYLQQNIDGGVKTKAFTDSAPILEREITTRAGLGWVGKNSCVISPKAGSTFLIAELFVDYPLKPDNPFSKDYCGTCQRCIQACPTNCILPDRTIDSKKCISYQTIENRGSIPENLRPYIGNWLCGCDICQMVCPWNHTPVIDSSTGKWIEFSFPDILHLLEISPQAFKERFKDSAMSRMKWEGFIRNILVYLGNTKKETAIPFIQKFLSKTKLAELQETAWWALDQIKQKQNY